MAYKKTYNPCDDCQYSFSKNNQESDMCKICEFRQLLDKPTADVVEVVRCKECLFSHEDPYCFYGYVCEKPLYFPVIGERPHRKPVQDSDYCSYGIRKRRDERK